MNTVCYTIDKKLSKFYWSCRFPYERKYMILKKYLIVKGFGIMLCYVSDQWNRYFSLQILLLECDSIDKLNTFSLFCQLFLEIKRRYLTDKL